MNTEIPNNPVPLPLDDVPRLLENSYPQPRVPWLWYVGGSFLLLVVLISIFGRSQIDPQIMGALSMLAFLGLIATAGASVWLASRTAQEQQSHLEAVEELIKLRRWGDAAVLLEVILSQPARTSQARFQCLVYLAAVLSRYHRFPDAIKVYEHILENAGLEGEAEHVLKTGRAMALLHEDRLFDADRAISELRRSAPEEGSAGLALVEIYRDVKTGHCPEAIELFEARRPLLGRQLGMRVADAFALVARAYDLLGQPQRAQALYQDATVLVEEQELQRRYPELTALAGRYAAAAAPAEAA